MRLPRLRYGALKSRWVDDGTRLVSEHGTAVIKRASRTVLPREANTCAPGDDSGMCEKPEDATNTQTLPIVLGLVIPLTCAIVVFILLHRRNKKKQALEDLNDPHKSLDFGLDMNAPPPVHKPKKRTKKTPPEMIITDMDKNSSRYHRPGLSLDELESPYLLADGVTGSRESLYSISRSMRDQNDPYRSVIFAPRNSSDTMRSPRLFPDNGSIRSGRSGLSANHAYNDQSYLVENAQRMSQAYPSRSASFNRSVTNHSRGSTPTATSPNTEKSNPFNRRAAPFTSQRDADKSPASNFEPQQIPSPSSDLDEMPSFPFPSELPVKEMDFRSELPASDLPIRSELPAKELPFLPSELESKELPSPPDERSDSVQHMPRIASIGKGFEITEDDRPYSDSGSFAAEEAPPAPPKIVEEPEDVGYDIDPSLIYAGRPPPPRIMHEPEEVGYDIDPSLIHAGRYSIDNSAPSKQQPTEQNRLSYMGVRPLPVDHPEENPEQRANRIRSFYKEYFDVNKPTPVNAYYEDYDADYTDNYTFDWYDPDAGQYYAPPAAPWAEPAARRAMTPPPRGAPRMHAGHDRHYSTMSGGRPGFRGRPPPRKNLPPPKALTSLPTPHMLKSDAALMNASDFAPPTSFRELQNGRRPDSPLGTNRPYSPAVRAFNPLLSSYAELGPIPSPHELRKSSTFTSLDFSPQVPRFRGHEAGSRAGSRAGSDAGSIRSARSGMSAMQMNAIRHDAYAVARMPRDYVTTKDDMTKSLRPKWDLTTPA